MAPQSSSSWIDNYQTPPDIEQPLASARPQGGQRYSTLPLTGGITPQRQIPKPQYSWNDIAAKLDPMMPQDEYDAMRQQYFQTHVRPFVHPMQLGSYWQQFKAGTERPKLIEHPFLAQSKLALLSAGGRAEELLNKLPGPQAEGLIRSRDELIKYMKRDGISTDVASFVGSSVPDLAAFAALEAGTSGVGGLLEVGAEAGSIASKAAALLKGTTFANRVARGSLMFGTMEAATAQQGEPLGYAFARGMGTGAAWEVGLAGLGRLARSGKGVSEEVKKMRLSETVKDLAKPKNSVEEVQQAMTKSDAPLVDQAMAQHVVREQELTRQQALPLAIKVDNRSPNVRLMGTVPKPAGPMPFTIEVKRYAEGRALQELQGYLGQGGQLQSILTHEDSPSALVDTLTSLRSVSNEGPLKFSMIKSALDQTGQPLKDWSDEKADAFMTALERKLDALERKRQGLTQEQIEQYMGKYVSPEDQAAKEMLAANAKRMREQRQVHEELAAKTFKDDGDSQVGGQKYPEFTLRDGVRGSRGLYARALERSEVEDPTHSALLNRPTQEKNFYVRADGQLAEWDPKSGLPSDNWTPKNLTQRQQAWELMRGVFRQAQGAKDAATIEARKALADFVQKSLSEEGESAALSTPRYRAFKPTLPDLTAQLVKHETPEGYKLTRAEAVENAKRIYSLWDRSVTDSVKQVNALALRDVGVQDLVPDHWRWTVSQPASRLVDEEMDAQIKDALTDSTNATLKDAKTGRPTTRAWKYSDLAPMFAKGMTDAQVIEETGLRERSVQSMRQMWRNGAKVSKSAGPEVSAWRMLMQNPQIPVSDLLHFGQWKKTGGFLDVMVPKKAISDVYGAGARAAAAYWKGYSEVPVEEYLKHLPLAFEGLEGDAKIRGIRFLPLAEQTRMDIESSMYHERMHIDLNTLRSVYPGGMWPDLVKSLDSETKDTLAKIVDSINKPGAYYPGVPVMTQVEETFTNVSAALRTGDEQELKKWGYFDTSVPHVVKLLDRMSAQFKDTLDKLPDYQELRTLRTRLEDLQRRTGIEWKDRLDRAALRQEVRLRYDGGTQTWHFDEGSRRMVIASKSAKLDSKALADLLDQKADFVNSVPSSTLAFERMGLTGPVFPEEMVRAGRADVPTPEVLPKSGDRFKGLAAVSALFTPMLSWASRLDQRFAKEGITTGLYEKVKAVDDKIREGQAWHEDKLASAAQLIPADSSKAKLMMSFLQIPEEAQAAEKTTKFTTPANFVTRDMPLSRTPKLGKPEYFNGETNWTQMAEKLGVDQQFLDQVRGLKQWIDNFQAETGIQMNNYLHHDLPRLQNFNYEVNAIRPKGLDNSELNRITRAIVEKQLNPADEHVGHFIAWAIREGFESKFTEQPLRELTKLLNAKDAEGKSLLGVARYNVDNYIKYVKGIPDATQQVMFKAMGDLQKNLGLAFQEVNKKLGTKLPTEFSNPGGIWQKYMLLSYAGGIGLRPAIWLRDAMQGVTNTLPVLGAEKFTLGMKAALRKGAWEEAMDSGALLGQHNFQSLYGDIFQEMSPQSGGFSDKLVEKAGMMLAPSRWGHNIARMVAYFGEYESALPLIKQFRENKIDFGELMDKTSLWFYDTPVQERFRKMLVDSSIKYPELEDVSKEATKKLGTDAAKEIPLRQARNQQLLDQWNKAIKSWKYSNEELAKRMGLELNDHTLWAYRRGTQPQFLRTGIGRIFGQYGLWPLSYLDFLKRLTGKLATNPGPAMRAMGYWYAANKAASMSFSAAGADVSKWFFISPAGYAGSPHLAAAQAAGAALENSQEGREARKTLLEYPMNFIPAYLELKNVAGAIENGGTFFNDDWSLTDDAIKVLGMHPKSQDLQLTPEEELQYQAGFTHRR